MKKVRPPLARCDIGEVAPPRFGESTLLFVRDWVSYFVLVSRFSVNPPFAAWISPAFRLEKFFRDP